MAFIKGRRRKPPAKAIFALRLGNWSAAAHFIPAIFSTMEVWAIMAVLTSKKSYLAYLPYLNKVFALK